MAENKKDASPGTNDYVVRMPGQRQGIFIERRWIDHPDISLPALGLLVYLEAHPEITRFDDFDTIATLTSRFYKRTKTIAVRDIKPLIEELIRIGYLVQTEEGGQ